MELTCWPATSRDLSHNWSGADVLRGDGGKVETLLFFDKKKESEEEIEARVCGRFVKVLHYCLHRCVICFC